MRLLWMMILLCVAVQVQGQGSERVRVQEPGQEASSLPDDVPTNHSEHSLPPKNQQDKNKPDWIDYLTDSMRLGIRHTFGTKEGAFERTLKETDFGQCGPYYECGWDGHYGGPNAMCKTCENENGDRYVSVNNLSSVNIYDMGFFKVLSHDWVALMMCKNGGVVKSKGRVWHCAGSIEKIQRWAEHVKAPPFIYVGYERVRSSRQSVSTTKQTSAGLEAGVYNRRETTTTTSDIPQSEDSYSLEIGENIDIFIDIPEKTTPKPNCSQLLAR